MRRRSVRLLFLLAVVVAVGAVGVADVGCGHAVTNRKNGAQMPNVLMH
jgi:hypothetical protein